MLILYPGLLFTASVAFIVSFFGFFVFHTLKRELNLKDLSNLAWTLFWLIFSLLWLVVGIRHLIASTGNLELDQKLFYLTQIIVFLHFPPLGYYIYSKITRSKKVALLVLGLFTLISVVAVVLLFKFGIQIGPITKYTTEYGPNPYTLTLFKVLLGLGLTPFYLLFFFKILELIRTKKIQDLSLFFFTGSIVLYGTIGYFDEVGEQEGWVLVLFRLTYLLVLLLVYIGAIFTPKEEKA